MQTGTDTQPKGGKIADPHALRHPTLSFYLDKWRERRGERQMPARHDIRLSDLKAFASNMVIAEVVGDGADFRFKLIGTAAAEYSFKGQTGRTVREIYTGDLAAFGEGVLDIYSTVAGAGHPVYAHVDAFRWINDLPMNFEAVHLPLSNDGSRVDFILSALVCDYAS